MKSAGFCGMAALAYLLRAICGLDALCHANYYAVKHGGKYLCAAENITSTTLTVASKYQCLQRCEQSKKCGSFNYKSSEQPLPVCDLYQSLPLSYSVATPYCVLHQKISMSTICNPLDDESSLQTCSFPYTYNGGLYYSCMENMAGVSAASQPFACINVNATPAVCGSCEDFTAVNLSVSLSTPTTSTTVPVMSVFGWIIFHQRLGYSFDWHLSWADYKAGFGSIDGDFWLGLERVHLLTSSQPYRLRIEMQEKDTGLWFSAEYWNFKIGDERNDAYRIDVSGYSGDTGADALQDLRDWGNSGYYGFFYHNGMKFSTIDRDNDLASFECAPSRGGGWWFNYCYAACLTCYETNCEWDVSPPSNIIYVQNSRMAIKPH